MISLPTVQEIVARQLKIQDDIESGAVPYDEGAVWITNLSKIITGAEAAELMDKEETSSEKDLPEATFAPGMSVTEDDIRLEMVNIYTQLQLGKISPSTSVARLKTLEPIARTFKGMATVEVNVNAYVQEPLPESIVQLLSDVEDYKRNGSKPPNVFLIEELAAAYDITTKEVELALRERKSLAKKKVKFR